MSYPQPSSNKYATGGYPYFRLNTELVSPGDIYESEQGSCAFAIGPDSDISRAQLYYFDDQVDTRMSVARVSSDRLLAGKLFARMDEQYLPAKRPGRILMAADDLYDPNWRPSGFGVTDKIAFIAPRLDIIQYFSDIPDVAPQRVDRRYYFQSYEAVAGTQYIVLPYYGRRYAYICARNANTTDTCDFGIQGLSYAITDDSAAATAAHFHQVTTLRAVAALAANGGQAAVTVTAGKQGSFDAIVVSITKTPTVLKVVFSDVEASAP